MLASAIAAKPRKASVASGGLRAAKEAPAAGSDAGFGAVLPALSSSTSTNGSLTPAARVNRSLARWQPAGGAARAPAGSPPYPAARSLREACVVGPGKGLQEVLESLLALRRPVVAAHPRGHAFGPLEPQALLDQAPELGVARLVHAIRLACQSAQPARHCLDEQTLQLRVMVERSDQGFLAVDQLGLFPIELGQPPFSQLMQGLVHRQNALDLLESAIHGPAILP